jgi:hypothetical protein
MTMNVFISYSHKDDSFRDDLEERLAMMKRSGIISVWHDRKINAGDDWKGAIDENLEPADIIIFLVSSSFLASGYCLDVEVQRAMEKDKNGSAKIISIIIRACDWDECDFSKFQAVPKDAKPIALWKDKDSAWLDAIKSIKAAIKGFEKSHLSCPVLEYDATTSLIRPSEKIYSWIDDTEIVLTHRRFDKVKLSDIYVSPDVEVDVDVSDDEIGIASSDIIYTKPGFYLVHGEEQQGKTSLLKNAYKEILKKSGLPIYIEASLIKKSDINEIIKKQVQEQYVNLDIEQFFSHPNKAILIDNLELMGINNKSRSILLEGVKEIFDMVVITCHSSFCYVSSDMPLLSDYKSVKLMGLGNLKREEIIRKWISLGVEEVIDEDELYSECDDLKHQLNTVIKRNIVPPKPINILMLMQMFEANAKLNLDLTSYGHCYQQLIYQSFEKAKISKNDFEKYLNVLTELAWSIFNAGHGLNGHELEVFFDKYVRVYLHVDRISVIKKLTDHLILHETDAGLGFKYPYIYYFFVAKKIAEGFSTVIEVSNCVDTLLKGLHREDYANILVFITHHTKEAWVFTKIKAVLSSLFHDNERATLEKGQLKFMDEFIKKIPELVLEQREIQKERDDHNRYLDEIEREVVQDEDEPRDILAKINKTFKGMEVAGQIIRNRHATMTRDELYELANGGASSGLRFLDYFIKISDAAKNEIIKLISAQLAEHPALSDQEVKIYAEGAYLHLSYGVISGLIRKISSSIGSKEAAEIYEALETKEDTPAFTLIKQAIELQFTRSLRIESVKKVAERLKSNPVCMRILKEMVLQHIYMFPVEYRAKQQLSSLLGISVRGQRLLDQKSPEKIRC